MAEDPEREARRIALSKEKDKLTRAQEWLTAVHRVDEEEAMCGSSDHTVEEKDFYEENWGSYDE